MNEGVEAAFELMKDRIRSTHVHDNNGKDDVHLFPLYHEGGTIDWKDAMGLLRSRAIAVSAAAGVEGKAGHRESAGGRPGGLRQAGSSVKSSSRRRGDAEEARRKQGSSSAFPPRLRVSAVVSILKSMIPRITIAEAGQHVGETVQIAGWLYNLRRSGKIAFPIVRDGYGLMQCVAVKSALPEELFETIKNLTQESLHHRDRQDPRRTARAGRLRNGRGSGGGGAARSGNRSVPDHAQGARHRFPDGSSPPVAAQPAAARHHPRAPRDHQGRARLLRFARLHAGRYAHLHAGGLRRHHHAVRSGLLRRRKGLSDAVRPALQRSHRHGVRQGLLLRAHVPRGKIEDAPPPDRVLDGGAGDGLRHAGRREARGRRDDRLHRGPRAGEPPRGAEAAGARRHASWKRSRRPSRA